MKRTGKILALFLEALMLCALLPMSALAEDGYICVYAQVPEGWENPCIWTWDADGASAFSAWPGAAMTADEANPGWYYMYIPNTMAFVIISANEGAVQTTDYAIEAKDAWITIAADTTATVGYDKLTTGDLPAYVPYEEPAKALLTAEDVVLVYANVPADWADPCVWTWDADGKGAFDAWPGGKMTADANNAGWSYIFIPKTMANVIISANEGAIQTGEGAIEPNNMWITVTPATVEGENATFAVSYEQQTTGDLPAYVSTVKLYAQVPADWTAPCAWVWTNAGVNAFEAWPGGVMELQTDGWYAIDIPANMENVIISANEGAVQTAGSVIETGKAVWIAVASAEEATVVYEKPAEPTFTVHAKVDASWTMPCIWSWSHPDGTNVFTNWPGADMMDEGNGWFNYGLPMWVNRLIINANAGAIQTGDIEIEAKELWVVVDAEGNFTLSYEQPAADAAAPEATAEPAAPAETAAQPNLTWLWITLGAVVVAGGTAGGIAIAKKKKKAA
ncbi:MAG: starch-binding protein [Clostridiaceae bacterium]